MSSLAAAVAPVCLVAASRMSSGYYVVAVAVDVVVSCLFDVDVAVGGDVDVGVAVAIAAFVRRFNGIASNSSS